MRKAKDLPNNPNLSAYTENSSEIPNGANRSVLNENWHNSVTFRMSQWIAIVLRIVEITCFIHIEWCFSV